MFQIVCEVSLFSPSDNESATAAAPSSSSYKPSPSTASLPSRLQQHKNKHTPDLVLDLPGTPDSGSVSLNNTPTTPKVKGGFIYRVLVLLGLMGNWQNWLSKWAGWWNISDQSQPNHTIRADGPPCSWRQRYFGNFSPFLDRERHRHLPHPLCHHGLYQRQGCPRHEEERAGKEQRSILRTMRVAYSDTPPTLYVVHGTAKPWAK